MATLNVYWAGFCCTGLPLASTRWILSTFLSHCPGYSNKSSWLTSADSIIFPLNKFWECWQQNLGHLGQKTSTLEPLCYAALAEYNVSLLFLPHCHHSLIFIFVQKFFATKEFELSQQSSGSTQQGNAMFGFVQEFDSSKLKPSSSGHSNNDRKNEKK